ncbi:hypothetical protein [Nitrosopumilus sp. b3]|uniref:hypothetical protein n=1 Tax=Nitrosopumilus sp. b3 TaxID=2109909 RepID=UPI0015F4A268|nr:hypothetical protein [Nitrosopumilus sp. b3]
MTENANDVYSEIDEELEITDEQAQELLKLNEKEIQILILSELKKITSLLNQRKTKK